MKMTIKQTIQQVGNNLRLIDNFLPKQLSKQVYDTLLATNFCWFYNPDTDYVGDGKPQMKNTFGS